MREGNCLRRLRRCRVIARTGMIEAEGKNCGKVNPSADEVFMRKFLFLLFCALPGIAYGQSAAEQYVLQERCGKRAAATFEKDWGSSVTNTKTGQLIANYENHYSERLNKCFYLEVSTAYDKKDGKTTISKMMRLFDVNENKEYATYLGVSCWVGETFCQSEKEFLQLIKQYME